MGIYHKRQQNKQNVFWDALSLKPFRAHRRYACGSVHSVDTFAVTLNCCSKNIDPDF